MARWTLTLPSNPPPFDPLPRQLFALLLAGPTRWVQEVGPLPKDRRHRREQVQLPEPLGVRVEHPLPEEQRQLPHQPKRGPLRHPEFPVVRALDRQNNVLTQPTPEV